MCGNVYLTIEPAVDLILRECNIIKVKVVLTLVYSLKKRQLPLLQSLLSSTA